MKNSFVRWSITLTMIILIWVNCANPIAPPGGPKDTAPPVILMAEPAFYSVNFSATQVRIYFDEFVQIKDLNSQLVISPPMDKLPDFKLKGKSLIISFKSPLKENTTYNIFLGDAIVDLNEGNPIKNLSYIFATGSLIDSLSVKGKVINAFTLKPEEDIVVMLYKNNSDTIPFDSLPFYLPPYYLSKTDANGNFSLDYLSADSFLIFALQDVNRNYFYDQPDEQIAFSDTLITPWFIKSTKLDATRGSNADSMQLSIDSLIQADTVLAVTDTIQPDTLQNNKIIKHPLIELYLFDELDSIQILSSAVQLRKSQLQFVFKHPDEYNKINLLNSDPKAPLLMEEHNKFNDTINVWFEQDSSLKSLEFIASNADLILDTIEFLMPRNPSVKKTSLSYSIKDAQVKPDDPLIINFDYPIVDYHLDSLYLIEDDDTLLSRLTFTDDLQKKALLSHKWNPEAKYKLLLPESIMTDISEKTNDSINIDFTIADLSKFGNLILNLELPDDTHNHIIRLMMEENIIKEYQTDSSMIMEINSLKPGNYSIIMIYDANNNGRWDPGNYIYGIQPEKIQYYDKTINIRENWDLKEDWDISGKSSDDSNILED